VAGFSSSYNAGRERQGIEESTFVHDWFVNHSSEIMIGLAIAVPLALVFAVVVVYWGVDEYAHAVRRRRKNKAAEKSVARLQKRISDLENYRNTFVSDKGMYLATFRIVLVVLFCMCASGATLISGYLQPFGNFLAPMVGFLNTFALVFLILAMFGAMQGVRIAVLDTKSKAAEMVEKLDKEITGLREKLVEIL
jgi:H+/gluconate symporter-like permease